MVYPAACSEWHSDEFYVNFSAQKVREGLTLAGRDVRGSVLSFSAGEEGSPAMRNKREDLFMQNAVGRFSERGIVGRSSATPNLFMF